MQYSFSSCPSPSKAFSFEDVPHSCRKCCKLVDYETFGVPEYWIVDYLALGGRRYIGNPKQPTISVYYLVDGEYQVNLFRGNDRIISPTFPELNLTAEQIFQAGQTEN